MATPLPDAQAIDKAIQLAGHNFEAMQHIERSLGVIFDQQGIDGRELLDSLQGTCRAAEYMQRQNSDGSALTKIGYTEINWEQAQRLTSKGSSTLSDIEQASKAAAALSQEQQVKAIVTVNFAVSEACEFLRGYARGGKKLPQSEANDMDDMINQFLAEHEVVSVNEVEEDGARVTRLYEKGEGVEAKRDNKNQKVKADAQKIRDLLEHQFPLYAKDNQTMLKTFCREHPKEKAPTQQTSRS